MSRNGPPSKRGRIDPNQTLSAREVEQELARENPAGSSPNKIILMTILNAHYPITVDIISKICKPFGQVDRIVIFQKYYVQAMVEYWDLEAAIKARKELHGCDIYSGCCTIKTEYAKTDRLNVRQNDEKTWDFTTEAPGGGRQQHGHDSGHRRVLLEEKPDMNPPAMQRMTLFDSSSHNHQGGGGSGGGGGSNFGLGGGYAQAPLAQSLYGGGAGHAVGGWAGAAGSSAATAGQSGGSSSSGTGGSFQNMWGGGYHAHQAAPAVMNNVGGGSGTGMGGVVMFYQLDPERFNCGALFNLVCQYGNVSKVCFLKNKEGCAMVEMGDAAAADRVLTNLNHVVIFDAKIAIERSRKPYIEEIRKPHQLPDGSESFCNYMTSRQNRFNTPERAAKNRFIPPTKVLHFYNVPKMTDDELSNLFTEVGAPYPTRIKWLEARPGSKSVTGLVEFETVSEACEALVLVNHAKVHRSSGGGGGRDGDQASGYFEMKLCFSKANNVGAE